MIYYASSGVVSSVVKHNISGLSELDLIQSGESYYRLILVFSNINYSSVSYSYEIDAEVSAEDELNASVFSMKCYPNPLTANTNGIFFQINDIHNLKSDTSLDIYNIKGQLVKSLSFNEKNLVFWNGKDQHKNPVTNGIYFYKLINGDTTINRKLIVLR